MKPPLSPARWAGAVLYTSGIAPVVDGLVTSASFREQAQWVFAEIERILAENELTSSDVISASVYLDTMDDFPELNEVYRAFFPEPYPVRTTIACDLFPGVLVEISVIATRGTGGVR